MYNPNDLIAFTGGGTAGHVYPGLAVAEELKIRGHLHFLWVGAQGGMEESLVKTWGMDFLGLPAGKLRRYFSFKNFLDLFKITAGFIKALWVLSRTRPVLLFSKGGFVSVPPVWAAKILGIPVFSQESDLDPGLATKLNMGKSTRIYTAYDKTMEYFPHHLQTRIKALGNPVRRELLQGKGTQARETWKIPPNSLLVLVLGGSQGAKQINSLVTQALPQFKDKIFWVHQTGPEALHPQESAYYHPRIFLKQELPDLMAGADLIISRAGAGALWEASALGKALLLVPLGEGSRGDQLRNAALFENRGAAVIWKESTGQVGFENLLRDLLDHPEKRDQLSREISRFGAGTAAKRLADEVVEFLSIPESPHV